MPLPISIQLYTVRELVKGDFPGIVRKIADIGYAGVEMAGLHGMSPKEFRKLADDLGIKVSSDHCGIPTKENINQIAETAKTLGYTVCVGGFGPDDFKSKDTIKAAADKYSAGAALLKPHGLKLAIHNHWWEFDKVDGTLGYDLFNKVAPGFLGELDVYWAQNFGAENAAALVKQYAKQLPLLHIKDGPLVKGQPHTAVGKGKMDIPACVNAADPKVTQWLIVELDEYTRGHEHMMEAVKDSYAYMTSKGLAKGRKQDMLSYDTLIGARDAIRAKDISAVELTREAIARVEKVDISIQAFNSHDAARALSQAKAVDNGERMGPLAGVPIAIKDNLCTSWGTTTCSSKILENFRSPYDATVVKKLEAAGAVILGKTNLDEFAMGSSTENSAFKTTRNPWDTTRVPGGSSGGSAAALAAGMCCASIGSDTGGSIRQPAALCGVVGVKPTYGRVSRYGLVAFASSLDQIGPFGWTVSDAALLMNVISGHDPKDSTSVPQDVPDYLAKIDEPIKGLRIGIAKEFQLAEGMDPQVSAAIEAAKKQYQSLGAELVNVSLPHTEYGIAAYYVIAPCEASSNLARYDGVHFGHRTKESVRDIVELYSKSRAEGFGEEVKRRIMIGTYALSSGYYDAYYVRALQVRSRIKQDFDEAFKKCDVILCPTTPTPAFKAGEKTGDPLQMYLCDVFTVTCNIAGIAGISFPCGFTAGERPLPIGLQLLAPTFGEETMLRASRMYEASMEWHKRRPQIS